jgi:hypothetical protein
MWITAILEYCVGSDNGHDPWENTMNFTDRMSKMQAAADQVAERTATKTGHARGYVLGRASHIKPIGWVAKMMLAESNGFKDGLAAGVNAHQDKVNERIAKRHAEIDAVANKEVCSRFFKKWNVAQE